MSSTHHNNATRECYVRDVKAPLLLLMLANAMSLLVNVPVIIQLIICSCCCVYVGCILSCKMVRTRTKWKETNQGESMGWREVVKLPIIASLFLALLYLLYLYFEKDAVNLVLNVFFAVYTLKESASLMLMFMEDRWMKQNGNNGGGSNGGGRNDGNNGNGNNNGNTHVLSKEILRVSFLQFEMGITILHLMVYACCSLPIIVYYVYKSWLINNVYAAMIGIFSIRVGQRIDSFAMCLLLLWLFFFYDIFWVYGTDAMLTVASKMEGFGTFLFPYAAEDGSIMFSRLGLGDIFVPGLLVSQALKYDIDTYMRSNRILVSLRQIKVDLFRALMVGYFVGILSVYVTLKIFNRAQPALLFIVPSLTIALLLHAYLTGELKAIWEYSSLQPRKVRSIPVEPI